MAKTYMPFDAGAGASVAEDGWRKMGRLWLPSGPVLAELNEFEVIGDATGMNVKAKSGRAWVNGHFFESDAQETLAIPAAHATLPRIDRAIIRADYTLNTVDLAVLQGTAAVSPVPPALTQSSAMHEISLAQISVPAADTSIAADQVTDERHIINRYGGVIERVKPSDQVVTNSTTLVNDSFLTLLMPANSVWHVEFHLRYTADGVPDFQFGMSLPTGADLSGWGLGRIADMATGQFQVTSLSSLPAGLAGNGTPNPMFAKWEFTIVNGATEGLARARFAQSTAHASDATMRARSRLLARQIR